MCVLYHRSMWELASGQLDAVVHMPSDTRHARAALHGKKIVDTAGD